MKDPDEENLTCDSCGAEIKEGDLYWVDSAGQTSCEHCLVDEAHLPMVTYLQ